MKILFYGLGSIGHRHAAILQKKYQHDLFAFRSGASKTPNSLGVTEFYSWDEVEKLKPDLAFITNPTSLHIETAIRCAELGCKLFIEKPVGRDLEGLDKLLKLVKSKKLVTYIAYNLRFHPVIKFLKKVIEQESPLHLRAVCTSFYPDWRKDRDHLKAYSARVDMGGGVILDLSHELDYMSYLLGQFKKITGNFSHRGDVTIDAEDYADLLIEADKAPVSIHINFLSHLNQRYIQVDFKDRTWVGDLVKAQVREYSGSGLVKTHRFKYQKGQDYIDQLKYFFDNIDNFSMMNNLIAAAPLFKQIVKLKSRK